MLLLAATLLLAGPLPAWAQSGWTGAVSSNWFDPGNWTNGVPDAADNVNVDTSTPNPAVISGGDAFADWLLVGQLTPGTLTVDNSGTLTSVQSRIGNNVGVTGAVTVSGTGSAWNAGFDFLIGVDGSGTLTIADDGTVNSTGRSRLGFSAGAQGDVAITGAGSTWNHTGDLVIGTAGDGNLAIESGGTATTGSVVLGSADDSLGSATVAGAGSSWTTGSLVAGHFGTGSVRVSDGGRLSSTFTVLGNGAGGGGGNVVTGVGSAWNTTGALIVGNEGLASLVITNGGTVASNAGAAIGNGGGQGTVSVLGAGSAWNVTGGLTVGVQGTGYFELLSGGTLVADSVDVGEAGSGVGSVTLRGDGSDATIGGELVVGDGGTGTLLIDNGGTLRAGGIVLGRQAGAQGTLTVSETDSLLTHTGTFADFVVGQDGSGTLAITAGGTVDVAGDAILGAGSGSGEAIVTGGAQWGVMDALIVGGNGSGTLSVAGGSVDAARLDVGDNPGSTGVVTVDGLSSVSLGALGVGTGGSGSLEIMDGAQVYAASGGTTVGSGGGDGTVTVTGPGSVLDTGGISYVGFNIAEGRVDVLAGGVVDADETSIGHTQDAQGTVNVSGAGSQWNNSGQLTAGNNASGLLDIADGGVVASGDGRLGETADGQGAATVDGPGSAWNVGGNLFIGVGGSGALDVTGGGAVVTGNQGVIGYSTDSAGAVNVTGPDSVWTLHNALQVGRQGAGELVIADGGVVHLDPSIAGAAHLIVGAQQGSTGTMTVTGAGSAWQGRDGIIVADHGTGALTIEDRGVVSDLSGILGNSAGGVGTVVVRGAGSEWISSGLLWVGRAGSGELAVEGGGSVFSASGTLGVDGGSQGTTTVTGPGSAWDIGGGLVVGNAGIGALSIENGATVSSATGEIGEFDGAEGHVIVTGPDSRWTSTGFLEVGGGPTATADIGGLGTLTIAEGGAVANADGHVGFTANSEGIVTVTGAGSSWTNAGTLRIGRGGSGTLTIADGGVVSATGAVHLGNLAGATGVLNIGAVAGDPAAAAGTLDAATLQFGAGSGTLVFNHTASDYAFGASIGGSGAIEQLAGTTILTGIGDAGGTTNVRGGTLLVEGSLGDTTTTVFDGATLGGSGAIGGDVTVQDGGILAPGSSAGTLTLGSLSLSDGSILDYELGQAGVIGGGVNDLIEISGNLTLDGTLDITDIGGFGVGVYRLMNYGGALTDNGLDLGALPTGFDAQDLFVQTGIAGQVNLVNSAGLTLSFWDGAVATEHNNGAIDDGDGTWNADNDNWTAADGAVNGRWDAGTFAVFGGNGGNVSVVGEQAVAGMQFMGGYTLAAGTDGALRVDGAESVVRVDPDVTATIAAPIVGAGGLVKTDTGTLVLSGENTYAGGTRIDTGTLQVSSDGNLGAAAGALSFDGGTLRNTAAFDSARTVTLLAGGGTFETLADLSLAGAIAGAGALTKTGDGTLTLTGTNTHAGGTTLAAGTLSVSADANLGDAAGTLTLAGGTLRTTAAFDAGRGVVLGGGVLQTDADLGLSGIVSGSAALTKTGAGTLTLTGSNTYTGGTQVQAGTLVGDVDAIRGNVDNDGTVVFDQSADASFGGTIVGSGDMVKRGAGALTLGAAGGLDWTIDAGALIARAAQFGGNAAIASGATLRFTEAEGTYDGTLSGAGAFEIAGADAPFALAGDSGGFAGSTLLEGGTLRIDGALGGRTSIASGATLTGTGTLGSVDNAGTVAAGNSIGTLTMTGDYTHRDGAVFEAEIEPGGTSDLLDVAGSATIEGGSVDVIKAPGQYAGGTRYTLIDAAGGVTGTFGALEQDLPFLDLLLAYDANHVYLDVARSDVDFDIVCGDGTFNQCQVADALDRIGGADPLPPDLEDVLTEVTTLTLDEARSGFDRLSGEAHASLAGAMLEGHALYGQTVTRRLAARREAVGAQRLQGGVWARGYGLGSDLDGDGNAHGAKLELYGLAVGADAWATESWLVGASLNTLKLDADFRAGDGGEADAKNASLYTSVQGERGYVDAVASYAWWDSEVQRRIEVGDDIRREARSDYGMHRFAVYVEGGLSYPLAGGTLQPLLGAEWSLLSTERFRETGADDVNLVGSAQNVERTVASAGLRWSGEYGAGEWTFAPVVQARWLHTFGDLEAEFALAFAGAPDATWRVRGVTVPEDRGLLGVGFQASRDNLDLFLDLDYQAGDGFEAASFGTGLRWRW